MNHPAELLKVVKRVAWFDPPEEILKRPRIFLAHLMNLGTEDDIRVARKYFSDQAFKDTLENAPPGVFTRRSWEHWNVLYGRTPATCAQALPRISRLGDCALGSTGIMAADV